VETWFGAEVVDPFQYQGTHFLIIFLDALDGKKRSQNGKEVSTWKAELVFFFFFQEVFIFIFAGEKKGERSLCI
jgi:hypothetical protein